MRLFQILLFFNLIFGIFVFKKIISRSIRYFLVSLLLVPILVQNFLLLIYSFLNESIQIGGINIFSPRLEESSISISFALLMSYSGIYIPIIKEKNIEKLNGWNFKNINIENDKNLQKLLLISSISWTLNFIANLYYLPLITPFVSFFSQSLYLGPAFAGFYFNRFRKPGLLFLLGWLAILPSIMAVGNRGFVFIPLGLFFIGLFLASSLKKKMVLIFINFAIFPFVLFSMAIIEAVRYNIRFDGGGITDMYNLIFDFVSSLELDSLKIIFSTGLERLIQWSNFVAPAVIPSENPYKFFNGFAEELINIFGFSGLNSDNQSRAIEIADSDFFYGSAKYIGYQVVHGYTVPYPGIAEGWTRFGWLGVLFNYALFTFLIIKYSDFFIRKYLSNNFFIVSIIFGASICSLRSYEYQISFLIKLLIQVFLFLNVTIFIRRLIKKSVNRNI
jgi:hypothetical protein